MRGSAYSRERLNDAYQKEPRLSMAFGTDQSPRLQDVENRRTLGSAASGHLVKAPLVRARAPNGALGDTGNDADAGPIEPVAQDSVPPPMRPALSTRCANPTFLSRATFPWPLPWPWPCVRVRSDAAQ